MIDRRTSSLALLVVLGMVAYIPGGEARVLLKTTIIDTTTVPPFNQNSDDLAILQKLSDESPVLFLVSFKSELTEDVRARIEKLSSAKLGPFVPENTFLMFITKKAAGLLLKDPAVQWIGLYHPEWKVSPSVAALGNNKAKNALLPNQLVSLIAEVTSEVTDGVDAVNDLSNALQAGLVSYLTSLKLGGSSISVSPQGLSTVLVQVSAQQAQAAATWLSLQNAVMWVEPLSPPK